MIDLSPHHRETVKGIFAKYLPECEIRTFAFRTTWSANDYSDLDLAVVGRSPLDDRTMARLPEAFEQSDLPMRVDVVDWHRGSQLFWDEIEREQGGMVGRAGIRPGRCALAPQSRS